MVRRELHPILGVAVLGVVLVALWTVGLLPQDLLYAAPLLAVVLPLLAGRYVGEEKLVAIAVAWHARRRRPATVVRARLPRAPRATTLRGGLLLASGRGLRGPPALAGAR